MDKVEPISSENFKASTHFLSSAPTTTATTLVAVCDDVVYGYLGNRTNKWWACMQQQLT